MPVSKNRRKKEKRSKSKKINDDRILKVQDGLYLAEHPFNRIPHEKLREVILNYGEESRKVFPGLLNKLDQLALECDPLHTLSTFSFYGQITFIDDKGVKDTTDNYITQHNIEIFHAFILRHKLSEFKPERLSPQQQTEVIDLTKELAERFHMQRITEDSSEQDYVIEKVRQVTQALRNWSYFDHVHQVITDLIAPLDRLVVDEHGASAVEVINLCAKIKSLIEDRMNTYVSSVRSIFNQTEIEDVLKSYYSTYPDLVGDWNEVLQELRLAGNPDEYIHHSMRAHHEFRELSKIYTFTRSELLDCGVSKQAVDFALAQFSFNFGDLATENPEYFFLGNPVWKRPFIKLDDERFFFSGVIFAFSFIFGMLEEHFFTTEDLRKKYFDRRAEYLEDKVEEIFKRIYPDADVYRGSLWIDGEGQYENDLAIKVGRHLVLVEAKAGRIVDVARRGAAKTLIRTINDLVVEPSKQSDRFKRFLLENRKLHKFSTKKGGTNRIDTSELAGVVRLNVTLDEFGLAQARVVGFQESGLIDSDVPLAPTIHIADLENIAHILDNPMVFFFYLMRREEMEPDIEYEGDELDLLGIFLENGFNMDGYYGGKVRLAIAGMSSVIDGYFSSKEKGLPVEKPVMKITDRWLNILRLIHAREGDWLTIGLHLLRASYKDQRKFDVLSKKLEKKIQKRGESAYEKTMVLLTGYGKNRYVFAYRPFKPKDKDRRHEFMQESARIAFGQIKDVKQTLVIARSLDAGDKPYTTLGLFRP